MKLKTGLTVIALCLSRISHAELVVNGSFEQGLFNPAGNQTVLLSPNNTRLTGWGIENSIVAWYAVGSPWQLTPANGNKWLDLSSTYYAGTFGRVSQNVATTPGQAYELSFQFGSSTRWGRPASIIVTAGTSSQSFISAPIGGDDDWQPLSMMFIASSASTRIAFEGGLSTDYVGLDQVSIKEAKTVPEPSTLLVLTIGLMVMAPLAPQRRNHEACLFAKPENLRLAQK